MTRAILAAACALLAIGCNGDFPAPSASSPAPSPEVSAPPDSLGTFVVGERAPFPNGESLQVHGYSVDMTPSNPFSKPREGWTFAAVDVEGCSGPSPTPGSTLLNPFFFQLVLVDGTSLPAGIPVFEPALTVSAAERERCERGYVTFEQPAGIRAAAVLYANRSAVRWTIPQ